MLVRCGVGVAAWSSTLVKWTATTVPVSNCCWCCTLALAGMLLYEAVLLVQSGIRSVEHLHVYNQALLAMAAACCSAGGLDCRLVCA